MPRRGSPYKFTWPKNPCGAVRRAERGHHDWVVVKEITYKLPQINLWYWRSYLNRVMSHTPEHLYVVGDEDIYMSEWLALLCEIILNDAETRRLELLDGALLSEIHHMKKLDDAGKRQYLLDVAMKYERW